MRPLRRVRRLFSAAEGGHVQEQGAQGMQDQGYSKINRLGVMNEHQAARKDWDRQYREWYSQYHAQGQYGLGGVRSQEEWDRLYQAWWLAHHGSAPQYPQGPTMQQYQQAYSLQQQQQPPQETGKDTPGWKVVDTTLTYVIFALGVWICLELMDAAIEIGSDSD